MCPWVCDEHVEWGIEIVRCGFGDILDLSPHDRMKESCDDAVDAVRELLRAKMIQVVFVDEFRRKEIVVSI